MEMKTDSQVHPSQCVKTSPKPSSTYSQVRDTATEQAMARSAVLQQSDFEGNCHTTVAFMSSNPVLVLTQEFRPLRFLYLSEWSVKNPRKDHTTATLNRGLKQN